MVQPDTASRAVMRLLRFWTGLYSDFENDVAEEGAQAKKPGLESYFVT